MSLQTLFILTKVIDTWMSRVNEYVCKPGPIQVHRTCSWVLYEITEKRPGYCVSTFFSFLQLLHVWICVYYKCYPVRPNIFTKTRVSTYLPQIRPSKGESILGQCVQYYKKRQFLRKKKLINSVIIL